MSTLEGMIGHGQRFSLVEADGRFVAMLGDRPVTNVRKVTVRGEVGSIWTVELDLFVAPSVELGEALVRVTNRGRWRCTVTALWSAVRWGCVYGWRIVKIAAREGKAT